MLLFAAIGVTRAGADEPASDVKSDEVVVLFPAYAASVDDGAAWEAIVRGWIYEPGVRNEEAVRLLRAALDLPQTNTEPDRPSLFQRRAALFLVDNERGKRIVVHIAGRDYTLEPSAADGHFSGRVRLSVEQVAELRQAFGAMPARVAVQLPRRDKREFFGELFILDPAGVSVISDMDDTIRVSHVRNKARLLAGTFLHEYEAVPGMAELYSRWAETPGVSFHFVSSSPWQLFPPLEEFRRAAGFPAGTYHLRSFRWKDERLFDLFASPRGHKREAIGAILAASPERNLVLVGDSGEQDPEIYGEIAREHPDRVQRIFIRDVTDEEAAAPRYQQAFRDLPRETWGIFRDPAEIDWNPPRE